MSLTVWCRPNQFDCQSYLVNHSSLFNQSPYVFHLDLYLANCFFPNITKLPFHTINHSTQRKKKDLAKQTVQVIKPRSRRLGGFLLCLRFIFRFANNYIQTSADDVIISQLQAISQLFSSYPPLEHFVKLAN